MAVIYEVSLSVDRAIETEYRAWLDAHVREMRALPGFEAATVHDVIEPAPPAGRFALCVSYRLRDREALDAYLREHAARMRADGEARFGGRFDAARRVLQANAEY